MRAALVIAWRDLRLKVRDRSALLISIVAPFALAVLFALILGDLDDEFHADWGYVDLDGGELAAAFEGGPLRALEAEGSITLERFATSAEARAAVEAGDVDAAIVVPEGFSAVATVASAGTTGTEAPSSAATLALIADPDAGISTQVARSVLAGYASEVEAVRLSVATALLAARDVPDAEAISALSERALAAAAPVALVDRLTADLRVSYATYYAAAMAILFVFFAAQFGVVSLHAEHRAGTLRRMLAAPVPWWAILAGKVIVSLVLALLSLSVIIVGTALLLGAAWGDPLALAALVLAAALAATGIALLAVAFTRNEEQAGSAVAIVAMTLAVVGGAFFPISQGPELLSQLSLISPHAWFLDGVSDVATGGDVGTAAVPVLVLAGIGVVCGGLGLLRGKRLVLR